MRLAYWMYEGTAHHGVGRIANSMRGVHAVFHAPQGDDYVNPIFTMLERTPSFPQMTTSVVSGRDLAQGTIRLPETLRQVEAKLHPDLMLICASCSTILLQEDLHQVAHSAGVAADILVYDANPYRMQEIVASEGVFTELVKRYASAQSPTAQPSVNLLGPASLGFHVRSDLIALRRMMATLGVEVNVVAPWGASIADLKRLPAAWVNIAPYRELGLNAAQYLESQFGMPTLYDAPIGVRQTQSWLNHLVEMLNTVASRVNGPAVKLPKLSAFSLDGMSAPSGVPWFTRTADMESFSRKRAFVFGDATRTVGVTRFLRDELGMEIIGGGTYLHHQADWMRQQLADYLPNELMVTDHFQDIAARIEQDMPDLVCGTQMERHSCRKLDVPCMVISPPTHIENHLLGYHPVLGFEGADSLADKVYTSTKLGLEKHLIDMFGDAGLEYEEPEATPLVATNGHQSGDDHVGLVSDDPIHEQPAAMAQAVVAGTQSPENGNGTVEWAPDAQALLKKIPFFVRGRVQRNTEKFAAEQGYATITADVLRKAREELGG